VEHLRLALAQHEATLVGSWEKFNEERLEHQASREELAFERERHKETADFLDRVFKEATQSGDIADSLRSRVAVLQAALDLNLPQEAPKTMGSPIEASPIKRSLTLHWAATSVDQRNEQSATDPTNIKISNDPEIKPSNSTCGTPLPMTGSQISTSNTTRKPRYGEEEAKGGRKNQLNSGNGRTEYQAMTGKHHLKEW
jgi:hypothetical protein